tara:strand:- start:1917 stop:2414 length:498 start_codon:yes stop_codon:yes gene_type:complete
VITKIFKKNIIIVFSIFLIISCESNDNNNAVDKKISVQNIPTSPPSIKRVVSPTGSKIYFITPKNDEIVSNPVSLEFGSEGVEIVPSGQNKPATGHHHIIIDAGLPNMNLPIPADDNYVHFGDGSSSTQLTLEPGIHTLQLLLGDFLHIPHDPPLYSEKITVTVE